MDLSSNIDDRSFELTGNFIENKMKKVALSRPDVKSLKGGYIDKKKERSKTPQPTEIIDV